jgi:hypothetical protein
LAGAWCEGIRRPNQIARRAHSFLTPLEVH